MGIYVDDIILAYRGERLWKEFDKKFNERFSATPAKKLQWFLGMGIDQYDDFSVRLSHASSIKKMAERYLVDDDVTCSYLSNDLFNKLDRAKDNIERAKVRNFKYASLVGALLYVGVTARPDIAFHTSILAKFMSDPSTDCCKAALQLMRYLKHTHDRSMYFSGKITVPDGLSKYAPDIMRNYGFIAYSDSSWGNKYPYPMFGYGIYLFDGLISFATSALRANSSRSLLSLLVKRNTPLPLTVVRRSNLYAASLRIWEFNSLVD